MCKHQPAMPAQGTAPAPLEHLWSTCHTHALIHLPQQRALAAQFCLCGVREVLRMAVDSVACSARDA